VLKPNIYDPAYIPARIHRGKESIKPNKYQSSKRLCVNITNMNTSTDKQFQ
jgi:hypothetical protein